MSELWHVHGTDDAMTTSELRHYLVFLTENGRTHSVEKNRKLIVI